MEFPEEIKLILEQATDKTDQADQLNKYAFENRNINPKLSLEVSEKALEISIEIPYVKGKADSLNNIGFYNMHGTNHEKALSCLFESLTLYNQLNDAQGIANTQYNLGLVHVRVGNFDAAIETFHKSLAYREKVNDLYGVALCYFQMTYINQHFNDWDAAFETASKSLQIRKEINDKVGIGASLMLLGDIYLKKKDLIKAKEVLSESLVLRKAAGEDLGYFSVLLRWAELHFELKEYKLAEEFGLEGLKMAKQGSINFGIVRFLQFLGKTAFAQNNISESKEKYTEALSYSQNLSLKSIEYELHLSLSEISKIEGDYKSALEHFQQYNSIKEEVINFQSNTRLKSAQLINQIEFAQKEAEIEKEKNAEINEAYKIISEKQKEILDSIHYAKRIQQSLLTNEKYIEKSLNRLSRKT